MPSSVQKKKNRGFFFTLLTSVRLFVFSKSFYSVGRGEAVVVSISFFLSFFYHPFGCVKPLFTGDSRALLLRPNGTYSILTKDHKPNDPSELSRILKAGGFVTRARKTFRVNGSLALSRAFGDRVRSATHEIHLKLCSLKRTSTQSPPPFPAPSLDSGLKS